MHPLLLCLNRVNPTISGVIRVNPTISGEIRTEIDLLHPDGSLRISYCPISSRNVLVYLSGRYPSPGNDWSLSAVKMRKRPFMFSVQCI